MTPIYYTSLRPAAENPFVFPLLGSPVTHRTAGSPGDIFLPRIFPMSGCAAYRSGKGGASVGGEGGNLIP